MKKWPQGGGSQSVAYLQRSVPTLKLTGTGMQADRQEDAKDYVLSQADTLIKSRAEI